MLNAVVAAALQHMAKAHQVGLDVGGRVLDRIAHPSLGRQVHHLLRLVRSEGRLHRASILQIGLDQLEGSARSLCCGLQLCQPRPLQGRVVVGVEVVEPQHRRAPLQQPLAQVVADEAGGAGDENGHQGVKQAKNK